jgi:hypothetical protein
VTAASLWTFTSTKTARSRTSSARRAPRAAYVDTHQAMVVEQFLNGRDGQPLRFRLTFEQLLNRLDRLGRQRRRQLVEPGQQRPAVRTEGLPRDFIDLGERLRRCPAGQKGEEAEAQVSVKPGQRRRRKPGGNSSRPAFISID